MKLLPPEGWNDSLFGESAPNNRSKVKFGAPHVVDLGQPAWGRWGRWGVVFVEGLQLLEGSVVKTWGVARSWGFGCGGLFKLTLQLDQPEVDS